MTQQTLLWEEFQRQGFVLVRGLLTPEEVQQYVSRLEALSGIRREDFSRARHTPPALQKSWTLPDGVSKQRDFWPLISDERLLTAVRSILGKPIRYLQHSDLHVGFSAIAWHRDSVNRAYGVGPDWDESGAEYQLVRVGIYLQSFAESNFRLGFIPGSNQWAERQRFGHRKHHELRLRVLSAASFLSPAWQMRAARAVWVVTEPGDCIIFDPRLLHSGSAITGPKYSIFLAYGIENHHFERHYHYYRHVRRELQYDDLAPELVQQLRLHNLLAGVSTATMPLAEAFRPGSLSQRVARHFTGRH
ncbi:MAG: phytanoyl-CoA dioxygenase family protein [candidate division KSB1 bacterium]|nr:phytanoyl-CoA dioxygenase family protein [candidate division KSB1 bacterium]MDZ7276184.1 phytanoyl-CoA dioxygenase family protein [candidate division KSB1 bacterium]MDZ7287036.1 phytanoyl-CoA dioxygenase family protein [candidate division KSB1 bacterium]MDZ7297039.1 phytanoyl-CoA dioxygenase family protein [candidate division KSB1 bacterium]MDZ7307200.1 phytanoyl-CoA dioxygenase family protein [candidate division KSB1 bacterium]